MKKKTLLGIALALIISCTNKNAENIESLKKIKMKTEVEQNRKVVDNFFIALETQKFEMLKEVFASNGRQLNPYPPEGFPKSLDGADAIYKQYSGLTTSFDK